MNKKEKNKAPAENAGIKVAVHDWDAANRKIDFSRRPVFARLGDPYEGILFAGEDFKDLQQQVDSTICRKLKYRKAVDKLFVIGADGKKISEPYPVRARVNTVNADGTITLGRFWL